MSFFGNVPHDMLTAWIFWLVLADLASNIFVVGLLLKAIYGGQKSEKDDFA